MIVCVCGRSWWALDRRRALLVPLSCGQIVRLGSTQRAACVRRSEWRCGA